ncbi:MAG: hypothetical protein AAF401_09170 [Pseudomonadota bacterium]
MSEGASIFGAFEIRDALTIIISIAALYLSYRTATRTSRLSQTQLDTVKRQGEAENKIAAIQAEVAHEQTRMARDAEIIEWAASTTALLSEMAELPVTQWEEAQRGQRWHRLRHQLSTQIDVGRFYFPNYAADLINKDRPLAYRGRRRRVLDHLVKTYEIFDEAVLEADLQTRRVCKKAIVAEKRLFVSEVQRHIDPARTVEFLDKEAIAKLKREVEADNAE